MEGVILLVVSDVEGYGLGCGGRMQSRKPTIESNEPLLTLATELAYLSPEQRKMVVDFARRLRRVGSLRLPNGLEGPEYETWLARVGTRSTEVLSDVRNRLVDAGLDPDGDLPHTEWPEDMAPSSKTSVTT
jgi:hypothetical protein